MTRQHIESPNDELQDRIDAALEGMFNLNLTVHPKWLKLALESIALLAEAKLRADAIGKDEEYEKLKASGWMMADTLLVNIEQMVNDYSEKKADKAMEGNPRKGLQDERKKR